jgi:hypothetical protein
VHYFTATAVFNSKEKNYNIVVEGKKAVLQELEKEKK